jgi:type II secretory pathway component PulM
VNLQALLARIQRWYTGHSARDRRIVLGVAAAIVLSLVYVVVVEPLRDYRRGVGEEIVEKQEQLERSSRFLGAADSLRTERDALRQRLDEAKQRLLPGGSATLGAAALQERANAIASEKGITVQSTQVMREEAAEPFRKISVRLTLSGELRPFSEFVSGLEYGPQYLTLPFVEVSRRGAVAGAKGPRTLSATVEVSGYLSGGEPEKPAEGEAGEAAEGEAAAVADDAAPEGEAPAAAPAPPPSEPQGGPAVPQAAPALPTPAPAAPQAAPTVPPAAPVAPPPAASIQPPAANAPPAAPPAPPAPGGA